MRAQNLLLIIFFSVSALTNGQTIEIFSNKANEFFKKNVTQQGLVDYQQIKNQATELESLSSFIKSFDYNILTGNTQKAYLIDTYNILVIKQLTKHYPTDSPKDINGFFIQNKHLVNSKKTTLDELEKSIFKAHFDPCLHFVLVCGARGCPPITQFAYSKFSKSLDSVISKQTTLALDNPLFIKHDENTDNFKLSELFKWYKSDFEKKSTTLNFINSYRTRKIPENSTIKFYTYDWGLNNKVSSGKINDIENTGVNLQSYTPSALMKQGQVEVKLFNNLFTQTAKFNQTGERTDINNRETYFSSIGQFFYGLNKQVNVGFDIYLKSVLFDDVNSSPLNILNLTNDSTSQTAISQFGPKFKVTPFKKLPKLSIQTTLLFPTASDMQGRISNRPWLEHDGYLLWVQVFYDHLINNKLQVFGEVDYFHRIDKKFEGDNSWLTTPLKLFTSYFPTKKITLYAMSEFAPTFGTDPIISTYYLQSGIGGKYQINPSLEIEALYTDFWKGVNWGPAGKTFNIGLRFIR